MKSGEEGDGQSFGGARGNQKMKYKDQDRAMDSETKIICHVM